MIDIAPDPDAALLLRKAAAGDVDAQSALLDLAFDQAASGVVTPDHGIRVGEVFARMAASHGRPVDLLRLAGTLFCLAGVAEQSGQMDDAEYHQAEAVAILSGLADDGDETAGTALQMIADGVTADVMTRAKGLVASASPLTIETNGGAG